MKDQSWTTNNNNGLFVIEINSDENDEPLLEKVMGIEA